jgi:hypothetical protein
MGRRDREYRLMLDNNSLQWMQDIFGGGADAEGGGGRSQVFRGPDGKTYIRNPDGTFYSPQDGSNMMFDAQGNPTGQTVRGKDSWGDMLVDMVEETAPVWGTALGANAALAAYPGLAGGGAAGGAGAAGGVSAGQIAGAAGIPELGLIADAGTAAGAVAGGIPAGAVGAGSGGLSAGALQAILSGQGGTGIGGAVNTLQDAARTGGGGGGSGGLSGLSGLLNGGTLADLLGGYLGYDAARDAAEMQLQGTREGLAEVRRQYDTSRSDLMPWMEAGEGALGDLQGRLPGLTAAFDPKDLHKDPGYQFELGRGLDAVNAGARASGSLDSGATLKALMEFGQGLASTKYNEAFNRDQAQKTSVYNMLAGISGTGQTTANQVAGLGQNASGSIASLLGQGANAAAAGRVGGANSWINALTNNTNRRAQNDWMTRVFGSNVMPDRDIF